MPLPWMSARICSSCPRLATSPPGDRDARALGHQARDRDPLLEADITGSTHQHQVTGSAISQPLRDLQAQAPRPPVIR